MHPDNVAPLALLRDLATDGLAFVVVGSAAFVLHEPAVARCYVLPDVDVVVADLGALRAMVAALSTRGFALTCWGEPLSTSFHDTVVVGRFYVRGERDGVVIDVTFEDAPFDVEDVLRRVVIVAGIPVCPLPELWRGTRRKSEAAAVAFARAFGLTMPAP